MIKAKIIADSICEQTRNRITTYVLTYPRFIHSEFMTHRVFSRNAASSRAIPISKMLAFIKLNPACPEYWGANQKGMQALGELDNTTKSVFIETQGGGLMGEYNVYDTPRSAAETWWKEASQIAIAQAKRLDDIGVHKQIVNRIVEPWSHITVLATATDLENFFKLRAHKDAQPEFQVLAYTMLLEYINNAPVRKNLDEWHIPFSEHMPEGISIADKLKIATARAARVSYNNFEGVMDIQKDYELHDRLAESGHWSPFEHCARCTVSHIHEGNFTGWTQYRKQFKNECGKCTFSDLLDIVDNMPKWVLEAIERNNQIKE